MPFFPGSRAVRFRSAPNPGHVALQARPKGHGPGSVQRSYSDVVAGRYRTSHNTQGYNQLTQMRNFWKHGERPFRRYPSTTSQTLRPTLRPLRASHNETRLSSKETHHGDLRPQNNNRNKPMPKQLPHNTNNDSHSDIRNKQDPEYQKFSSLVKKIYQLMRSHHHQEKVSKSNNTEPTTFVRLTHYLSEVIKPAKITQPTLTLIEGNAKNWAYTTKLILQDHYAQCINTEGQALKDLMISDWRSAFEIAVKWYQNKYRRRHLTEPIERVKELLTSLTDGPDQAPSPTITTQQEEETPNITDFPPLTRNWHSPPPSPDTPPPIQPNNPPPEPLPLRTPRKPRDSAIEQNPAVANVDDDPDFFTINTCPTAHNTTEAANPAHIQIQQDTTHNILSQVVMIHPEVPNPQLIQETGEGHQMMTTDDLSVDSLLCISEQDTEWDTLPIPQLTPISTPTPSPRIFRATRHMNTPRKLMNWTFTAHKKWCIIGDSNLSRIPPHNLENLQIDSYPGATFRHAETFIAKARVQTEVETLILAFGINHRGQKQKETAVKQLQRAIKTTKERFPRAAIWIPLINYSKHLKREEKDSLSGLNTHIKRNMPYLPPLPDDKFEVGEDHIHWTANCAKEMLDHWCKHLNFEAL